MRPARSKPYSLIVISVATVLLVSTPAYAYLPIGAGLSAIGSLFAVIAAVFLGVVGFVWYPIKRFLRFVRGRGNASGPE